MFLIGGRLRAHIPRGYRRVAVATSVTSMVVPFGGGLLVASLLHDVLAPAGIGRMPFALFMATAMSITAFPVLARIVIDCGLMGTRLGSIAIACAACDDVAGWLILSTIAASGGAAQGRVLAMRGMWLALYLASMVLIVRPLLRIVIRRRHATARSDDVGIVLLVILLSALATEAIGIHALFGAFFAGLMMPDDSDLETAWARAMEPIAVALLLPLFFAFTGLRTNVASLDHRAWRAAAAVLAVAVAGKGGASALAARVSGMSGRDAAMIGVLLNTRGLIELVVLNVGLDLGILSPVAFSIMVLMALVTNFLTTPIVKLLQRRESGASVAIAASA